jgi:hypothetical protein
MTAADRSADRSADRPDDLAGIDDLFGFGDEPEEAPRQRRERGRTGWWLRNILGIAVFTATIAGLGRMGGVAIPILLIAAGLTALRALWLIVAALAPPPPPVVRQRGGDESRYVFTGGDALRAAVRRWENRMQAPADGTRFSRNVLPVLTELTDERLRQRHGLTRGSDPVRARELLGEPLWQLLSDGEENRRPPKQKEWAVYLAALEKL